MEAVIHDASSGNFNFGEDLEDNSEEMNLKVPLNLSCTQYLFLFVKDLFKKYFMHFWLLLHFSWLGTERSAPISLLEGRKRSARWPVYLPPS